MNEMQVLNHEQFGQHIIRADDQGNAVFVLKQVAVALGYRDAANARRVLDGDEHWNEIVDLPTQEMSTSQVRRRMVVISESGLYHLIFKSTKPEAKVFRRWVTEEVLPTLRKAHEHGIDAIGDLKERITFLEGELETEKMTTESEHLRNRAAYLEGVKAGRHNPDIAYGMSRYFRNWEQG